MRHCSTHYPHLLCNVAQLQPDLRHLQPFDGQTLCHIMPVYAQLPE